MPLRPTLAATIRSTLSAFRRDNASRFGAALAFYILFSITPVLLIGIAVAGAFFGRQQAEQQILDRIGGSFGSAAGTAVAAMIRDAASRNVGWLATTLGLTTLYFGLTGVYRQIDDAIRTIWCEKKEKGGGVIRRIERKLASIFLVIVAGGVVLLSIAGDAAIAITGRYAASRLVGGEPLWHAAQLVVSTMVLTLLFAVVFRQVGQGDLQWRDVRPGAALTAVLFVIGKFALGLYLGKAAVGSAFGAAGSVVVVLLWSYWSAQIFFFGLEFTHVYARGGEVGMA